MNQELRTLLLIILGVAIGLLVILGVACAVFLCQQESPRRPERIAPGLTPALCPAGPVCRQAGATGPVCRQAGPADAFFFTSLNLRIQNLAGYKYLVDVWRRRRPSRRLGGQSGRPGHRGLQGCGCGLPKEVQ